MLNNLGVLHSQMGERDREIEYLSQAVELARTHGIHEMEAMGLANIAFSLSDLGRHDEAIGHAAEALRIHRTLPEGVPRASALGILGRAQRRGGRYADSLASYREGLAVSERTGASYMQAECLDGIGLALVHLSGPAEGVPYLERALGLFTAMGHRRGEEVRAELVRLRGPGQEGTRESPDPHAASPGVSRVRSPGEGP